MKLLKKSLEAITDGRVHWVAKGMAQSKMALGYYREPLRNLGGFRYGMAHGEGTISEGQPGGKEVRITSAK